MGREGPTKHDPVNSPSHYTHGGIDTIDYIEAKGLDNDAYLFNVIKYVSRAGYKISKLEDLKKAQYYLNRRIKSLEASEGWEKYLRGGSVLHTNVQGSDNTTHLT